MKNNSKRILGIIVLCFAGITRLSAVEADTQALGYINLLLNNQFLLENARLVRMAEECLADSRYEEAIQYAARAERYADMSDGYVDLQMLIRETNNAIEVAQARLNRARAMGAATRFAEVFEEALGVFDQALELRENEQWAEARAAAIRVIVILDAIPGEPTLPAQIQVRTWHGERDCLWNIAAMPEVYGDPWQWPRLYEANRDRMPQRSNPDLIHPDMILDIPSIRGEIRYGMMIRD